MLKEERTEIGNKYLRMYFYNMGPCPPCPEKLRRSVACVGSVVCLCAQGLCV